MNRFLQAVLALCGLVISALIGWQGYVNDRIQNKQAFMNVFSQQATYALKECDDSFLSIAVDAANEIDKLGETHFIWKPASAEQPRPYADYARDLLGRVKTCKEAKEGKEPAPAAEATPPAEASRIENLTLRLEEGAATAAAPAAQTWYAVLASYPATKDQQHYVLEDYERFSKQVAKVGLQARVEVFRTSISKHYAVVLGSPDAARDRARDLVRVARDRGWSSDAFVQDNRNWKKCDPPSTAEGLDACAR